MIIHDIDENNFEEYIKEGTVIIDFFATWCGPCKMLTPELENLSKKDSSIKIIKVDIDKYQNLAIKNNIMAVPTMLLYKDGKLTSSKTGYMPLETLYEWITKS